MCVEDACIGEAVAACVLDPACAAAVTTVIAGTAAAIGNLAKSSEDDGSESIEPPLLPNTGDPGTAGGPECPKPGKRTKRFKDPNWLKRLAEQWGPPNNIDDISDALHDLKGGIDNNPDVFIDPDNGNVFAPGEAGQPGDYLGNLRK